MNYFNLKNPLWHMVSGLNFGQLGVPRYVEKQQLGKIDSNFYRAFYRSGFIAIEEDRRPPFDCLGQEKWCDWVKYVMVLPSLPRGKISNTTFFICSFSLEKCGEFRICSEPRTINQGPFAVRLREKKNIFLLSEDQSSLSRGGSFGGDKKPPGLASIDLY